MLMLKKNIIWKKKSYVKISNMITNPMFIIAVFVLMWAIRLLFLNADTPGEMVSHAIGYWAHNAKNAVLFGRWTIDDFNPMFGASLFAYLVYLSFKIFGVGLWQTNFVSAISGCLTLIFTYLLAKELSNSKKIAVTSTIIYGINSIIVYYSRQGITETLTFLLITVSLYFWLIGKYKSLYYFISGFVFAFGCISKSYGFMFILVIIGFFAYEMNLRLIKKPVKTVVLFGIGFLIPSIVWLISFVLPNLGKYQLMNSMYFQQNISFSLQQTVKNSLSWILDPSILVIGNFTILAPIFIFVVLYLILNYDKEKKSCLASLRIVSFQDYRPEIYSIIWIILGLAPTMINNYISARRFIIFIIPMSIIVARFIFRNINDKSFLTIMKNTFDIPKNNLKKTILIFMCSLAMLPTLQRGLTRAITLFNINLHLDYLNLLIIVSSIVIIYSLISIIDKRKDKDRVRWYLYLIIFPIISGYLSPFLSKIIGILLSKVNIGEFPGVGPQTTAAMSTIVVGIVLIFIIPKIYRVILQGNKNLIKTAFSVGIIIYLLTNVFADVMPLIKPQYKFLEISRDLNRYFKRGTPVLGIDADILCIETKAFAFPPWAWRIDASKCENVGKINYNPVERFKPKYMTIVNAETDHINAKCTKKIKSYNLVKVKEYRLDDNVIELFEVLYNKREKVGGSKISDGG